MMTKINVVLDDAADMVLAVPSVDPRDSCLAPAKEPIGTGMITSLKTQHVEVLLIIKTDEMATSYAVNEAVFLKNRLARIDKLFKKYENNALNLQFKQSLLNFYSDDRREKN